MDSELINTWGSDWGWGLPLVVFTVIFHAYGLGLIYRATSTLGHTRRRHISQNSILAIGVTSLAAIVLHALESAMWAVAYQLLGALPNYKSAMLYSLNALTSYGHASLHLAPRWELMGALEALNGWILFGLTTAFLFTVLQKAWNSASPVNA